MEYRIQETCVVCWKCMDACPVNAIVDCMINISAKYSFPGVEILQEKCTKCGQCMEICPVDAIEEYS